MDVHLLGVTGAPEGCLVSFKAGSCPRRQAAVGAKKGLVGAVGRPLRFNVLPGEETSLHVDVMQHVGSQRLLLKPREEGLYRIQLAPGAATSVMVKSRDTVASKLPLKQVGPIEEKEEVLQGLLAGAAEGQPRTADGDGVSEAAQARTYLEGHAFLPVVKALLETIVREQPDDPYAFAADQFAAAAAARNAADIEARAAAEAAAAAEAEAAWRALDREADARVEAAAQAHIAAAAAAKADVAVAASRAHPASEVGVADEAQANASAESEAAARTHPAAADTEGVALDGAGHRSRTG
mmetsp:Transcript_86659/g.242768  ORF Transcript_86659/g.242768 Transcript_86659/m.242768 type:complete len:296 (-) Transcript_86659:231-1118(-)